MATIQIPNHSHCLVCQRAVPYDDKTCSKECQTKLDEQQSKRKRQLYMLYGLMAIAFAVAIAPLML